MITKITDYAARALSLVVEQFKRKKTIDPIYVAVSKQVQEIEDAFWQITDARNIDTAEGDQLDIFGKIVGERRGGTSDIDYRLRIRAKIRANLSNGTLEDIYAVFRALLANATGTYTFQYEDAFPAGFVFRILGITIPPDLVYIFVRFLKHSRGAAIAAWLGWQELPDTDSFFFARNAVLSAVSLVGATSLACFDTSALPPTGTVKLDEGLATEETLAYTSKTLTSISGFIAGFAHAVGSSASLTTAVGKGFGDETNPVVGGGFVGAAFA